jgi:hypothetical protein
MKLKDIVNIVLDRTEGAVRLTSASPECYVGDLELLYQGEEAIALAAIDTRIDTLLAELLRLRFLHGTVSAGLGLKPRPDYMHYEPRLELVRNEIVMAPRDAAPLREVA